MRHRLIAGLVLCLASLTCHAQVFLMARGKIEGTDYVTVDFLSDPRMATQEDCEAERRAARTTGFEIFRRVYVTTHRGFSSQLQTYCVETDQPISPFVGRQQHGVYFTYLVNVTGKQLQLTRFDDMGACSRVAGAGNQQSETRYCARSRQFLR